MCEKGKAKQQTAVLSAILLLQVCVVCNVYKRERGKGTSLMSLRGLLSIVLKFSRKIL